MLKQEESEKEELIISNAGKAFLSQSARWTNFLAIIGFIFSGLAIVAGLFAGSFISAMSNTGDDFLPAGMGWLFGFIYVLMGLLYFFPSLYLLKFSQKSKSALLFNNSDDLNLALENQKSFFKFWGILVILSLVLYIPLMLGTVLFRML